MPLRSHARAAYSLTVPFSRALIVREALGWPKEVVAWAPLLRYTKPHMIEVTRKDSKESTENLVRRFNRRVQQSGLIIAVKQGQYFEKPISKRDRRQKAIIRQQRKALKLRKIKLGQR